MTLLFKQLLYERKAIWLGTSTSTSASQTSVTQTSLRNSKTGFHQLSSRNLPSSRNGVTSTFPH